MGSRGPSRLPTHERRGAPPLPCVEGESTEVLVSSSLARSGQADRWRAGDAGQASRAADESAAVEFIFASESLKTVAQVARAGAGATGDTWRRLGASASSAQRVWLACRFARLFVCLRRRVLPWRAVLSTLNRRRRHDESRRARRGSKHCFPSCWKAPLGKALPQVRVHTTRRSVESMQQPLPVWDGRRRGGQTRTYEVRTNDGHQKAPASARRE